MWLSDFEIVLTDRVIQRGAIRIEDGKAIWSDGTLTSVAAIAIAERRPLRELAS